MSDSDFPRPLHDVIATLVELFRNQRATEIVNVLENADARFFHEGRMDEWNAEIDYWTLLLEIPATLFSSIEAELLSTEEKIKEKLQYITRALRGNAIHNVTISPTALVNRARVTAPQLDVLRLWPEGRFRLFLSHVAKHKVAISNLKNELHPFGISAFVAHEDIAPSLDWQDEIELALKSMHALLALVTPDFQESNWTDQETGWAFGRGVLVLPVRLEADPYGFTGKVQGIGGSLDQPQQLAKSVFETLLGNSQTHNTIRRAFANSLCNSRSFSESRKLCEYVSRISDFSEEEKSSMLDACKKNNQLANANGVPDLLKRVLRKSTK